ncbi:MAG: type II toxin-antitoxin system HicA family toxin [Isosphaeraceae bacterium]
MNRRQQRTLESVFARPVRANIDWRAIESLLIALGAEVSEAKGSRVCVLLNGRTAVFHRPHPEKEAGKHTVRSVRDFLENAGVRP